MMKDLIREAPFGQLLRFITGNRVLLYPEEQPDFVLPDFYQKALDIRSKSSCSSANSSVIPINDDVQTNKGSGGDLEKSMSAIASQRDCHSPITSDGSILVDWYTENDQANPKNWSNGKRAIVAAMICLYTFAVYAGSAIYTSSELGVILHYGVSEQKAVLPLSLYVLAYGTGPLLFGPLSEIPSIGRNPVYALTFTIYVLLCAPTALVNNFTGLLVLRFAQGFFGSPCLANGGASMHDLYSELSIPFAMTVWVAAAYGGPALGPLISGFAVTAQGWRFGFWEILMLAGPICILLNLFLAETSAPTILHRRAQRLRVLTKSDRFRSYSEIQQSHLTASAVFVDAIIKPIEICLKDPAVTFANLYTSLIYSVYYSFFVAVPLVFPNDYGFDLGELGLVYSCILVACTLGAIAYASYIYFVTNPRVKAAKEEPVQEYRLVPALVAVFLPPVGLFLFGWTARSDIHWIVPIIGITIFSSGIFVVLQCICVYIPRIYPRYHASLFAANDFCRSALAAGAIHFASPLYTNLGIGKGVSVLAGISVIGIVGMWVMWGFGAKLRARSSFAVS